MKKFLLSLIALLAAGSIVANNLPQREGAAQMKQLNAAERHVRPAFVKPNAGLQFAPMAVEAPEVFYEVPFLHTLGKGEANITGNYVGFDVNEDTKTWKIGGFTAYSVCMKPAEGAMDDWMISPAIHLVAGKTYMLSVQFCSVLSAGTEEKLAIYMGGEQTVEAMTTPIVAEATATQGKTLVDVVQNFTVNADGYYYIGFHAMSEAAKSGNMKLCNFAIEDPSERVDPPAAGELTFQVAPKGELKAAITYTAPTTTLTNAALAAIDSVQVSVNYKHVLTLTDVNPGDVKTFDVDMLNNFNVVEAVAYVKDTPGAVAKTPMFFAGYDNPQPLTNVKATLSADCKTVTLTWDKASSVGENGGYVDVDKVTYYVFNAFGSVYDPAIAVTSETSATFDYSDLTAQDFAAFEVTAGIDETYYSLGSVSNIVVVGPADAIPFTESFSNKTSNKAWVIAPETDFSSFICQFVGDNELPLASDDEEAPTEYLNSHDADNGFYLIMPVEANANFGFCSVKADISKAANPVLEFYYQGKGSALDVLVAAESGDFEVVKTIDLKENPTDGWTLCRVELNAFKQAAFIRVELRVRSIHNTDSETWSVPIDNIRIRDLVDSDLRLAALKASASVNSGKTVDMVAAIENLGSEACTGAMLEISDANGVIGTIELPEIASMAVAKMPFLIKTSAATPAEYTITATVKCAKDMEESNNSASATTEVIFSAHPTPVDLTATAENGTVTLAWTAPSLDGLTGSSERFEDFEDSSYEPLTISDFGGWTLYDGDGGKTYTFLSDSNNPFRTMPMAFQLYDPVVAGVPDYYLIDCPPHSGDRLLMGYSTNSYNDNWLISPALSGKAQTISFYGRSFTIAYPEEFEVLYSTTDTSVESFIKIDAVENYPANGAVPEDWTKFSFDVPEGAKYFAVHHIAYDSYALMLDDFTFEAGGVLPDDTELIGYNVYRNGIKVNEDVVTALTATDTPAESGTYSYGVSAVYNNGESRIAGPVSVVVDIESGISNAAVAGLSVTGAEQAIIVKGAAGANVTVYSTTGAMLHNAPAADAARIAVPAGIYLVKVGNAAVKVAVK